MIDNTSPRHDILRKNRRPGIDAPLDRRKLAHYRRPYLLILAGLGWAYSWIAWVWFGAQVVNGLLPGLVLGIVLAVLATAGQLVFSDDSLLAYLVFLAPDAVVSYLFGYDGFELAVSFIVGEFARIYESSYSQSSAMIIASILCGVWSVVSARLPERVIFGPRLRRRIQEALRGEHAD